MFGCIFYKTEKFRGKTLYRYINFSNQSVDVSKYNTLITAMLRLKFIVQGNCYLKILQHIKQNFWKDLLLFCSNISLLIPVFII